MPCPSPKSAHSKPVPFHGEVCEEFDATIKLIIHIIKQAVDDYTYGKTCKILDKKKRRLISNRALAAKRFLYSKDVKILFRVIGFGEINSSYLSKMLESNNYRRPNWLRTRT